MDVMGRKCRLYCDLASLKRWVCKKIQLKESWSLVLGDSRNTLWLSKLHIRMARYSLQQHSLTHGTGIFASRFRHAFSSDAWHYSEYGFCWYESQTWNRRFRFQDSCRIRCRQRYVSRWCLVYARARWLDLLGIRHRKKWFLVCVLCFHRFGMESCRSVRWSSY